MAKDCGHKVPCGCGDSALTTPAACNTSGPCEGEQCSELFDQQCIVYTGPEIRKSFNGTDFIIPKGMRLDHLIQKLLQAFSGDPEDLTDAAFGLRISNISSTGFTLTWKGNDTISYNVFANQVSPVVNNSFSIPAGTYSYTFNNLVSGAEYKIFVEDPVGGWNSASLYLTLP